MGADALTAASTMMCAHAGSVRAVPTAVRVKLGGSPVLVQGDALLISACPFTVPPGSAMPCVSAAAVVAATRVKANGKPVLTSASSLMTTGTGPPVPVTVVTTQTRVKAT